MSSRPAAERFIFVDAMRGIACMGVLLYHLLHHALMERSFRNILPFPVQMLCDHGAGGVEVFFVISGFVVAHSLRDFTPSMLYVGSFILRRQIRLDPAYWCTMAFVLCITAIERLTPFADHAPGPGIPHILENMFYLQNILHAPQILLVAGTLCIELQFYLVFVLLVWIAHRIDPKKPLLVVGPVLVMALALASSVRGQWTVESAYFPPFWYYFAAGVMCSWALRGVTRAWACIAFLTIFGVFTIYLNEKEIWSGFATAAVIYIVGYANLLTVWTGGRVLQYLGRISYSLYLVHLPILSGLLRFAHKFTHDNRWAALFWFLVVGGSCVAAAHLWYLAIERPTLQMANRLKDFAEPSCDKTRRKFAEQLSMTTITTG